MAHHEFLRRLGLCTIPEFLSAEECARLRAVAEESTGSAAQVYREGEVHLDESHRKTLSFPIQGASKSEVEGKIKALRDQIERHFDVKLDDIDGVTCLLYRTGDFFVLHSDTAPVYSGEFSSLGRRCISVVVFLNGSNHPTEPFDGGELTFYGLMDLPSTAEYGFPVDAETGLLVAFRAVTKHEVTEVTQGKRYALVTWFLEKETTEDGDADHDDVHTDA